MAKLSKQMIDFCIDAYRCLKDETNERVCFIKYRQNDERYIDFVMQKDSYYFGKWVLFENSSYAMNVDESVLRQWLDERQPKPEEPKPL